MANGFGRDEEMERKPSGPSTDMSRIIQPTTLTRWEAIDADVIDGEQNIQAALGYAEPNMAVKVVRPGAFEFTIPTTDVEITEQTASANAWYSEEVTDAVTSKAFTKLLQNTRYKLQFTEKDLKAYWLLVARVYCMYITSRVALTLATQGQVGTLGELPQAIRNFFTDIGEGSDKLFELQTLEPLMRDNFVLPPRLQTDIRDLFTAKRLGSEDDAPVGMYACAGAAVDANSGAESLFKVPARTTILSQSIDKLLKWPRGRNITVALLNVYGDSWRLNTVESAPIVPYDASWMNLWENSGRVYDAPATGGSDTVVPNFGNDDKSKRTRLPVNLTAQVDERFVRYFHHGYGKKWEDAAAFALSNFTQTREGDIAIGGTAGTNGRVIRSQFYGSTDPTAAPEWTDVPDPISSDDDLSLSAASSHFLP